MRKNINLMSRIAAGLMAIALTVSNVPLNVSAEAPEQTPPVDPVVMVSMGDSYSSGEGILDFYGQEKEYAEKIKDYDWVAHRSKNSWPGMLQIPGVSGWTRDYRNSNSNVCRWYFVAASGAETCHFSHVQVKECSNHKILGIHDVVYLPKQLEVFGQIDETVDYVTLTVGGNDVDFAEVITKAAVHSQFLGQKQLKNKIEALRKNMPNTMKDIKDVYTEIENRAPEADIIVAGYPKLLDKRGKGALLTKSESKLINENVTYFNEKINSLVTDCKNEGMKIHFVDVEAEFDKDGGHQAYSDDPWINKIMLGPEPQDIDQTAKTSSFSIHPNKQGALAYARCVDEKLQEIENAKRQGTLSGKICRAYDRITPIGNAQISIYQDDAEIKSLISDNNGQYSVSLPAGDYKIVIQAEGYLSFTSYATVVEQENTYQETFLMIEGEPGTQGVASGRISSALTSEGIENVRLTIRESWNNTSIGGVVATAFTDAYGDYSVTLPLGNYTIYAEKDGFVPAAINIIVQEGETDLQHGVLNPVSVGTQFRIVLSWGENPRDLDSHVCGTLSNGGSFHVYYSHKSEMDGDVEICNLDVDDTSSYGPETITLNCTTGDPYYYYIYKYAGNGTVSASEAQIKVYSGENLLRVFNVPSDQGNGDYWNVFAIVDGQLVIRNTIDDSSDLTYAGSSRSQTVAEAQIYMEEDQGPKL